MREKIYTIPVNEAFDLADGCPVCRLYKKLEENELEIILGASQIGRASWRGRVYISVVAL